MLVASLSGRKFAPYTRRGERASSLGQAGARRAAYRVSQNGAAGNFCVFAWMFSRTFLILVREARIEQPAKLYTVVLYAFICARSIHR